MLACPEELPFLASGQYRSAVSDERVHKRRRYPTVYDQIVLGAADEPVIERLAGHDRARRSIEISVGANPGGCIARAAPRSRRAGAIRGLAGSHRRPWPGPSTAWGRHETAGRFSIRVRHDLKPRRLVRHGRRARRG